MNNKQITKKILKEYRADPEAQIEDYMEEALSLKDAEVKKAIDETFKEFKPKSIFIINFCNELLSKLGLLEEGKK